MEERERERVASDHSTRSVHQEARDWHSLTLSRKHGLSCCRCSALTRFFLLSSFLSFSLTLPPLLQPRLSPVASLTLSVYGVSMRWPAMDAVPDDASFPCSVPFSLSVSQSLSPALVLFAFMIPRDPASRHKHTYPHAST